MTPVLNISLIGSYDEFLSTVFNISGAIYPGVPHFKNKYGTF